VLRASAVAEEAGVPSVSLTCEGFLGQAATTATGLGLPSLPVAIVPGHVDVQTVDELRANVLGVTVEGVVQGLTAAPEKASELVEPEPGEIVFEGTPDEINRFFYENGSLGATRSAWPSARTARGRHCTWSSAIGGSRAR
jgi:hypothetical protein